MTSQAAYTIETQDIKHRLAALPTDAPPRPTKVWAVLAVLLAVCLPPLLIALGVADSKHTMENISLMSSQETWLRQRGWHDIPRDPKAYLMPSRNGLPRIVKPPMLVWLNMLAWGDLTPGSSTAPQLTYRARLVTVALGLIMLGAVFWAGMTLGDLKLAGIATLVAGSTWFFERQARTASYDIHMAAWASLSVAAGLWAIAPFRDSVRSWQRVAGWGICGLALAMAWMSKGPLSIVVVLLPLGTTLAVVRRGVWRHVLGVAAAVALAAALCLPWYWYAFVVEARARAILVKEFAAPRPEFQPPYYYLGLLGLMLPWTLWLIAGLCEPFVRAVGQRRRRLLIAWLWFVVIFVFFSIPPAKQQRYILPIIPAAALLIAQVFCDHAGMVRQGRPDPGARMLYVPHWIALILVSMLIAPVLAMQETFVAWGWTDEPFIGGMGWPPAVVCGLVLLGVAVIGAWTHIKWQRPESGAALTAIWGIVVMTIFWWAYAYAPDRTHPIRSQGERVAQTVGDSPIRYFRFEHTREGLNEEFLFYGRRIIPAVEAQELAAYQNDARGVIYVVADTQSPEEALLRERGFTAVLDYFHDFDGPQRLWRYEPAAASAR